ncbi:MAG: hypothetical protein WCT08_00080 [Patescibacteria group bacterium]|jgi:hypothetical protein
MEEEPFTQLEKLQLEEQSLVDRYNELAHHSGNNPKDRELRRSADEAYDHLQAIRIKIAELTNK